MKQDDGTESPADDVPQNAAESPARQTREDADGQGVLFAGAADPAWQEHWWGMPAFEMHNALPTHRITVNFLCFEDVEEFARRLGLKVTRRTDSTWFPPDVVDAPNAWEYQGTP